MVTAVRLLLHLASVWLWVTAVAGLVWLGPRLDTDDAPEELRSLHGGLRTAAELAVFGLVATGVWSAVAVGPALESPPYAATLLLKVAAFIVSGLALASHQRRGPSRARTAASGTAVTAAIVAVVLGIQMRS